MCRSCLNSREFNFIILNPIGVFGICFYHGCNALHCGGISKFVCVPFIEVGCICKHLNSGFFEIA
jgi:hypothetical protein